MSELAEKIARLPLDALERLVRLTNDDTELDRRLEMILPRTRSGPMPLSYAQERLWFLAQLQPGSGAYNLPLVLPFAEVDVAVLQRALTAIVARHEALRTTFVMASGVPVQRIAAHAEIALEEIDLTKSEDAASAANRLFAEEVARPFDLQRGPLVRAKLIRRGAADTLLVVNMHHIVSDGWSMGVLRRELETLYAAFAQDRASPLDELRVQYADFAVWQREWLQGETLARQLDYWRDRLTGAPALLDLPYDRPRPAVESYRGAVQMFSIAPSVAGRLQELARERQATLFMVVLAVFAALLSRLSGLGDIVVGSPIANRNRAELERMIGFFVNMLALRIEVSPELTVRELVDRVREITLGGYEHQDLPFEKLVAELHPRRSLSYSPVYQVAFVLQNTPEGQAPGGWMEIAEPGWDAEPLHGVGTSKFDVTVSLGEQGGGLVGSCEYRTDLFGHRTIGRLVRRYARMLAAAASDPELAVWQLPLALPEEAAPSRWQAPEAGWLAERLTELAGPESAAALAAGGVGAAQAIGLGEADVLAVLDGDDEMVRRLGRGAALAADAHEVTVDAAGLAASGATHVLLTPAALARLNPAEMPAEAVIAVAGLPCFSTPLERWKGHRIVGLWGVGTVAPCCATLWLEQPEAVIGAPAAGFWIEVLDERMRRQAVDAWGMIHVGGVLGARRPTHW